MPPVPRHPPGIGTPEAHHGAAAAAAAVARGETVNRTLRMVMAEGHASKSPRVRPMVQTFAAYLYEWVPCRNARLKNPGFQVRARASLFSPPQTMHTTYNNSLSSVARVETTLWPSAIAPDRGQPRFVFPGTLGQRSK